MTAEQLRMARALLRLGIRELSAIAGVDKMAISRMEAGARSHASTVVKLKEALEKMGIVFIGSAEPVHGPAVAMRWGVEPPEPAEGSEIEDVGDGRPSRELKSWDALDTSPAIEQVRAMADYWARSQNWGKLSEASRRSLTRAIGKTQITE